MNELYKIQRGTIGYLMGKRTYINDIVSFDYMGAAEFEFDAIPNAHARILNNYENYKLHVTDVHSLHLRAPLCVFCDDRFYDYIYKELRRFIREPYHLKEYANFYEHFRKKDEIFKIPDTDFWWDIDMVSQSLDPRTYNPKEERCVGDFMMFIGSEFRQKAFMDCMNMVYNVWWCGMDKDRKDAIISTMYQW